MLWYVIFNKIKCTDRRNSLCIGWPAECIEHGTAGGRFRLVFCRRDSVYILAEQKFSQRCSIGTRGTASLSSRITLLRCIRVPRRRRFWLFGYRRYIGGFDLVNIKLVWANWRSRKHCGVFERWTGKPIGDITNKHVNSFTFWSPSIKNPIWWYSLPERGFSVVLAAGRPNLSDRNNRTITYRIDFVFVCLTVRLTKGVSLTLGFRYWCPTNCAKTTIAFRCSRSCPMCSCSCSESPKTALPRFRPRVR